MPESSAPERSSDLNYGCVAGAIVVAMLIAATALWQGASAIDRLADAVARVENAPTAPGDADAASDGVREALAESIDLLGGVEFLPEPMIDHLVDRLNESGYDHQPIDPDDPLLKRRIVLICEGMHERVARRVIERLVYLDGLDPATPIDLRIATSGGWTDSAFAIVDTMRAISAPVDITAIGGCYSAGTVILAAGTGTRSATPNALMSIHVNDFSKGDDFAFDRQELARFRDVYRRYTKIPQEWFDASGDNQYYLTAEQALEMKLIDEIATD